LTGESNRALKEALNGKSEPTADAHGGGALAPSEKKTEFSRTGCALAAPALIAFAAALWLQVQAPQRDLFLSLNHWAAQFPPMAWSIFTTLGDASVLLCLLSPLLVWRPRMMFAMLAAAPLGGLLSLSLKAAFRAHRPATHINPDHFNVIGPLLNNDSFPSGHTITAFAIALALVATLLVQARTNPVVGGRAKRTASGLREMAGMSAIMLAIIATAALVGLSRIAVGAHWPVDVLAGAACGWLAGVSGAWVALGYPNLWQATISRFVVGQLLLLTALWLMLKKPEYPQGAPAVWLAVACVLGTVVWQFAAMYRSLQASRNSSTSARKPVV
jgi:membrane-associated phospholipid phosphatase